MTTFFRFLLLALSIASGLHAADKPNILFLFADDQSFETIRAFGHTDIETPNLDRLVARGTTFTHAYNMGAWVPAVCLPSRIMLNTGRSLWDAQSVAKPLEPERKAGRLWSQLLAQSGYQTFLTGKWHVPVKPETTFDVVKNVRAAMPRDTPEGYNRPRRGEGDPWSPSDPKFGGFWAGGKHWSEVVADDAIEFLQQAKDASKPFFIYAAFNAPHDPRQSPRKYVDLYPSERVAVPRNFLPEYPHKDAIGCGLERRDERLAPFPRTEEAVKVHRGEYYALITHMDEQIGRVLDALEHSGQADSTWIAFTADHGLAVGHHGLFGKQNMYETSLRAPFVIAGPGVRPNRRIAAPIYIQDVMPTVLELAGAAIPQHVYFKSVLPLVRGDTFRSPHSSIYGAYLDLQRAVIDDGYKLMVYPEAKRVRLYNLTNDPHEMTDLAARPEHVPTQRRLFQRLLDLQRELGDTLNLRSMFPDL